MRGCEGQAKDRAQAKIVVSKLWTDRWRLAAVGLGSGDIRKKATSGPIRIKRIGS